MSLFIDQLKLNLKAGNGGNGCVAFLRQKYIPFGGPSGGNGGDGGSIYLVGKKHLKSLVHLKGIYHYVASNGEHGKGNSMSGKMGKSIYLEIPLGTVVLNRHTHEILFDIVDEDKPILILQGGKGGKGNIYFKNSTNQAPEIAEAGEEGENLNITLEFKMLADVGLIGFPNAGKSSLIRKISNSQSMVANYPFSTLQPHLGVVYQDSINTLVVADIPGIIQDSHLGKGLGFQFLKHIERCYFFVYILDALDQNLSLTFQTLQKELELYSEELLSRDFFVVLNKIDLIMMEERQNLINLFLKNTGLKASQLIIISALTGENISFFQNYLFQCFTKTNHFSRDQFLKNNLHSTLSSIKDEKISEKF